MAFRLHLTIYYEYFRPKVQHHTVQSKRQSKVNIITANTRLVGPVLYPMHLTARKR
jgi:hypothetical protein